MFAKYYTADSNIVRYLSAVAAVADPWHYGGDRDPSLTLGSVRKMATMLTKPPHNESTAPGPFSRRICALAVIDIQEKLYPDFGEATHGARFAAPDPHWLRDGSLILVSTQYAKGLADHSGDRFPAAECECN